MRQRIAHHPNAVRYEELAQLLKAYGFVEQSSRHGTSHRYWKRGAMAISVPIHRPHMKRHYVNEVLRLTAGDDAQGDLNGNDGSQDRSH